MYLQYRNHIKWEEVNDYIQNTDFDINNLPYQKLGIISKYAYIPGGRLTEESKKRLIDLELKLQEEVFKSRGNSKVIFNGIKGTLRKVKDGEFAFFKPRGRKPYFPVRIDTINSLEFLAP